MSQPVAISRYSSKQFGEFVDSINLYQFQGEEAVSFQPEGHIELIFQLDEGFQHKTQSTNGWENRPVQFIGGMHRQHYQVRALHAGSRVLGIQFKPEGARHFVSDRLDAFKDQVVDLRNVWAKPGLESFQGFLDHNQLDWPEKVDDFLASTFQYRKSSLIDAGLKLIGQTHGAMRVKQIASKIGMSVAQFRKRFNEEIGMSPKEYGRVVRIQSGMEYMLRYPDRRMVEIAYMIGYYDQSHFTHDFTSVVGMTPKHYRQQMIRPLRERSL